MFGTKNTEEPLLSEDRVEDRKKSKTISKIACKSHADKEDTRDDDISHAEQSYVPFLSSSFKNTHDEDEHVKVKKTESKWRVFGKEDDGQKKVVYNAFSNQPAEVLHVEASEGIPHPENSTSVVIKVEASTISLNDCVYRRGMSLELTNPVCLPGTPGGDVVGVIVALGNQVEQDFGFKVGDRVAALTRMGGNARYAVVPGGNLVKVPKSVSSEDAACMVSTFMTAYQALQMVCPEDKSLSGKKVLVIGGGGPLGQALIQFVRRAGAQKIFTTVPESRNRHVRKFMGATPLPLEPSEWLPLVEGSLDVVFDSACQDGYKSSQAALNDDGTLVCVGMYALLNQEEAGTFGAPLSAYWTKSKASYFMSKTKTYEVYASFSQDPERFKRDLETLFVMLKKKEIKTNIVKRAGLSGVAQAHTYIENGKALGSVVCVPWKKLPKQKKDKDEESPGDDDATSNSMSLHSWYN